MYLKGKFLSSWHSSYLLWLKLKVLNLTYKFGRHSFKLSNCVIDYGASGNVMPIKVANCLGLTLTKIFGSCYSMDNKQVPLIGQIKDAQFAFAAFPDKKIKMTILVADVPASYGMLLGRNFCKDVGGELNMEMTEARIPIKGVVQKLVPEKETKYMVVKSNDLIFDLLKIGITYRNFDKI